MEEGLIDKSCFFQQRMKLGCPKPAPSWAFNFFNLGRVRRVTAHRCPGCAHVELTAP
jgi:hypothetical protein